jgi:hypothetical protein
VGGGRNFNFIFSCRLFIVGKRNVSLNGGETISPFVGRHA